MDLSFKAGSRWPDLRGNELLQALGQSEGKDAVAIEQIAVAQGHIGFVLQEQKALEENQCCTVFVADAVPPGVDSLSQREIEFMLRMQKDAFSTSTELFSAPLLCSHHKSPIVSISFCEKTSGIVEFVAVQKDGICFLWQWKPVTLSWTLLASLNLFSRNSTLSPGAEVSISTLQYHPSREQLVWVETWTENCMTIKTCLGVMRYRSTSVSNTDYFETDKPKVWTEPPVVFALPDNSPAAIHCTTSGIWVTMDSCVLLYSSKSGRALALDFKTMSSAKESPTVSEEKEFFFDTHSTTQEMFCVSKHSGEVSILLEKDDEIKATKLCCLSDWASSAHDRAHDSKSTIYIVDHYVVSFDEESCTVYDVFTGVKALTKAYPFKVERSPPPLCWKSKVPGMIFGIVFGFQFFHGVLETSMSTQADLQQSQSTIESPSGEVKTSRQTLAQLRCLHNAGLTKSRQHLLKLLECSRDLDATSYEELASEANRLFSNNNVWLVKALSGGDLAVSEAWLKRIEQQYTEIHKAMEKYSDVASQSSGENGMSETLMDEIKSLTPLAITTFPLTEDFLKYSAAMDEIWSMRYEHSRTRQKLDTPASIIMQRENLESFGADYDSLWAVVESLTEENYHRPLANLERLLFERELSYPDVLPHDVLPSYLLYLPFGDGPEPEPHSVGEDLLAKPHHIWRDEPNGRVESRHFSIGSPQYFELLCRALYRFKPGLFLPVVDLVQNSCPRVLLENLQSSADTYRNPSHSNPFHARALSCLPPVPVNLDTFRLNIRAKCLLKVRKCIEAMHLLLSHRKYSASFEFWEDLSQSREETDPRDGLQSFLLLLEYAVKQLDDPKIALLMQRKPANLRPAHVLSVLRRCKLDFAHLKASLAASETQRSAEGEHKDSSDDLQNSNDGKKALCHFVISKLGIATKQ